MKLSKLFIKNQNLEAKMQDLLSKKEEEKKPININYEKLSERIYKHLFYDDKTVFPYRFFFEKTKEKVESTNPNVLERIEGKIKEFEQELDKYNLKWEWLSENYSEKGYKKTRKDLRNHFLDSLVISYSRIVNYLPTKAASIIFGSKNKDDDSFSLKKAFFGVAAYVAVLAGETVAISMTLGYGWVFAISALATGIYHVVKIDDVKQRSFKKYFEFFKEYKKANKNKIALTLSRAEKEHIKELVRENLKIE